MSRNSFFPILSLARERGTRGTLVRGAAGSLMLLVTKNFIQLGVAVLLARILEPSGYGKYAFAMSLVMIVSLFVMFGLPGLLTREVAAGEAREDWSSVRGLIRRSDQLVLLALAVTLPVGFVTISLWPGITQGFRLTLAFALAFMTFNVFAQLRAAQLQGHRHVVIGQIGMMWIQPGALLAGVALAVFVMGLDLTPYWAFAMAAGAAFLAFAFNAILARHFRPEALDRAPPVYHTRRWLSSAWPFAIMGGLFLINSQADIVMLGFLSNSSTVGLYRVAAMGATLVLLVLSAVNPVISPTFARLYALGDNSGLKRTARAAALVSLLAAAPVVAVYIVAGKPILDVVFGQAYRAAWLPLVILTLGQFINAAVGSVGMLLNMTGHERDSAWVLGGTALLNIILNAALIPFFGMAGAAISTAVSMAAWNFALSIKVKKRLGFIVMPFFK